MVSNDLAEVADDYFVWELRSLYSGLAGVEQRFIYKDISDYVKDSFLSSSK